MAQNKLIPHTANSLTVGLTDKLGDNNHLAMSQKGVKELLSSEDGSTPLTTPPSDGKYYCMKDGEWVEIPASVFGG